MTQPAFNPNLKEWQRHEPSPQPGAGRIEEPGHWENIVWQTRSREPNAYEVRLIEALEQVFAAGAEALGEVVNGLNDLGAYDHGGRAWSEASFREAMAQLGY